MSDWREGYVGDVGYTYGYYGELNPLRVKLAFLNNALAFPEFKTACELGFGQGLSTNIHAAASLTEWYGTDFDPSQAGFAQDAAAASGSGAKLVDEAFLDYVNRTDLPDFDFIGLHGIWAWISDANRAVIVDFIRRKLKVGGVVYMSYNSLPGWSTFEPIRQLIYQHAEFMASRGTGVVGKIDSALAFADQLLATNPAFLKVNPKALERFKKVQTQNRHYLAHEYFNANWNPMHFAAVAELLEPTKAQFGCSAHYLDQIDVINLTPDQQAMLKEISHPVFRETTRDLIVNQSFRRDYWIKGPRRLSALDQAEQLRTQRVMAVKLPKDVPLRATGALGEANLTEAIYLPILEYLADQKPKSLGQIEAALAPKGIQFRHVLQALMVLIGTGSVATVQDDAVTNKVAKSCERLNAHLMSKARGDNDVTYLASPLLGGGVPVSRVVQLFLLAMQSGRKQPSDWADFAWQIFAAQNQKLVADDRRLETAEENIAELNKQAKTFAESQLPILKTLRIA